MPELGELNEMQKKLMDPKLLAMMSKLEIKSRQVVEGIFAGLHKSPYKGFSVEFAEHREYVPGDELKYLDWKVYGKSDKLFIKEFEEETELKCNFLVDTSASMLYKSDKLSKLEYADNIVASLSFLLLQQGDSVGVTLFDEGVKKYLPPRGGPRHFRLILEELVKAVPGKDTDMGAAFHDLAEKTKKRGLVVIVSDFFDKIANILVGLAHFKHKRHDVIVFHIMDRDELTFPFDEMTMFKGLETFPDLVTEPWQVRQGYLQEVNTFVNQLKKGCEDKQIDYVQVITDEPLDQKLSQYLSLRQRIR